MRRMTLRLLWRGKEGAKQLGVARDICFQSFQGIGIARHLERIIMCCMTALEEIHRMPLREKLLLMEAIWDDISREEQSLDMPQWHKETLDERERLIEEGKAKFIDWEEAKKQIKEATE